MKEIPLTQGKVALVDDEDFDILDHFLWFAHTSNNGRNYYAKTNTRDRNGNRITVPMHRLITWAKNSDVVDHVNGNTLDNRRCNLRLCTNQENSYNKGIYKSNKTGYKGVHFNKATKFFVADITVNKKRMPAGASRSAIHAAYLYDIAAEKHYGEFARLNFPRLTGENAYFCGYEIRTTFDINRRRKWPVLAETGPLLEYREWDGTFERRRCTMDIPD